LIKGQLKRFHRPEFVHVTHICSKGSRFLREQIAPRRSATLVTDAPRVAHYYLAVDRTRRDANSQPNRLSTKNGIVTLHASKFIVELKCNRIRRVSEDAPKITII